MSKATEEDLGALHGVLARGLTEVLKEGVAVVDKEGDIHKTPASAAYFMAAITFVKNNNITADPSTNEALSDLKSMLDAKRKAGKSGLTKRAIESVADMIERDLPGYEQ